MKGVRRGAPSLGSHWFTLHIVLSSSSLKLSFSSLRHRAVSTHTHTHTEKKLSVSLTRTHNTHTITHNTHTIAHSMNHLVSTVCQHTPHKRQKLSYSANVDIYLHLNQTVSSSQMLGVFLLCVFSSYSRSLTCALHEKVQD